MIENMQSKKKFCRHGPAIRQSERSLFATTQQRDPASIPRVGKATIQSTPFPTGSELRAICSKLSRDSRVQSCDKLESDWESDCGDVELLQKAISRLSNNSSSIVESTYFVVGRGPLNVSVSSVLISFTYISPTPSQESPYQSTQHHKMQRRAPTHDISLYPSPKCPWHAPSQLALYHPRALAVLSAHHHINQLRFSYCDCCELREQILFDIVRSSRLSCSLREPVNQWQ